MAAFKYVPEPDVPGVYWTYAYDGPRPTKLKESAWSAAFVAQGILPPVEDRMPAIEDVLIQRIPTEAGIAGGTRRTTNSRLWRVAGAGNQIFQREPDGNTKNFNVLSWAVSDDGRVWTFKLRKGMRWSDGMPFTMDDVVFAITEVNDNKWPDPVSGEMISIRGSWSKGLSDPITGEKPKFEVVDDLTFTFTFDNPKFTLNDGREQMDDRCGGDCWYGAKHYWKQFHPKYQDKTVLAKMMEDQGKKNWKDLFRAQGSLRTNPFLPTVGAYSVGMSSDNLRTAVHNPFYFVADPEGNQLPYIHEWHLIKVESRDVAIFRGMAGESDVDGHDTRVHELPLYVANKAKTGYSIRRWADSGGVNMGIGFNQSWNEDPEIGKWIRTKAFREALSMGIDRDVMNEVLYLGLGEPRGMVPHASNPYYPGPEFEGKGIALDIAGANAALDALGLTAKDGDGFRLRSDGSGQRLSLRAVSSPSPPNPDMLDLLTSMWIKIGIELKYSTRSDWWRPVRENVEYLAPASMSAGSANPWYVWWGFAPCHHEACHIASGPGKYKNSSGTCSDVWCRAKGVADPTMLPLAPAGNYAEDVSGGIARMQEIFLEGDQFPTGSPERIALGQEFHKLNFNEKYRIGMVGFAPSVVIVQPWFHGVPQFNVPGSLGGSGHWTYWFTDGANPSYPIAFGGYHFEGAPAINLP
jgi:peptide/nickel transport system substrate-binding protein